MRPEEIADAVGFMSFGISSSLALSNPSISTSIPPFVRTYKREKINIIPFRAKYGSSSLPRHRGRNLSEPRSQ